MTVWAPGAYEQYIEDTELIKEGIANPEYIYTTADVERIMAQYLSQDAGTTETDAIYAKAKELIDYVINGFPNMQLRLASSDAVDELMPLYPLSIDYYFGDRPVKPALGALTDPPSNFTYIETPYVSSLLDALKAKLLTDILNGGTGLTLAVENEIYARESERDLRTLGDTVDRLATRWAESGFVLPDGVLTAMTSWVDLEYQNKYSDKSRKIAEDSFKMAVENTRFTVEQSSKLEDILMQFNSASNKNKLEAAVAILESGIKIFEAKVKRILADVDLYKAESDAFKANAEAVAAIAGVEVEYFNAIVKSNASVRDYLGKIAEINGRLQEANLKAQMDMQVANIESMSRINAAELSQHHYGDDRSTSFNHSIKSGGEESTFHNHNYAHGTWASGVKY